VCPTGTFYIGGRWRIMMVRAQHVRLAWSV
jgi:hypothetical protein